jgi:hypothetical protein
MAWSIPGSSRAVCGFCRSTIGCLHHLPRRIWPMTASTVRPSQWVTWKTLVGAYHMPPKDPLSPRILRVRAAEAVDELAPWLVGSGYDEVDFPEGYQLARDLAHIGEVDLDEVLALARMG